MHLAAPLELTLVAGPDPVGVRSWTSTGNDSDTTGKTVNTPPYTQKDDVILAKVSRWNGNPAITPPAGFTQWGTQYTSGDGNANITYFWKRLTGPEPAASTYTFAWTGSLFSHVHVTCIPGAVTSGTPIETVNGWSGTAGTFGSTAVTPAGASILIWTCYNDSAGTHTPPTGTYTEIIDFDCGATAYTVAGAGGSQSAANATVTSSSPSSAVLLAITAASTAQNIALGRATETDLARTLDIDKIVQLGKTTSVETGRTLQALHSVPLQRATEADTSRALSIIKQVVFPRAIETDTARSLSPTQPIQVTLNRALETDTGRSFLVVRNVPLGRAAEVSTARPLTKSSLWVLGRAVETQSTKSLTVAKRVLLGRSVELDLAQVLSPEQFQVITLGRALETDVSRGLSLIKRVALQRATELDTARLLTIAYRIALGRAVETQQARLLIPVHSVQLSRALEVNNARQIAIVKALMLGRAVEDDLAFSFTQPILNWPPTVTRGVPVLLVHATSGTIHIVIANHGSLVVGVDATEGEEIPFIDADPGESP